MEMNRTEQQIDISGLPRCAELAAAQLRPTERGRAGKSAAALLSAAAELEKIGKGSGAADPAAQVWLRDNAYVLRRDAALAAEALRGERKLRRLPGGQPLVCAAADALVRAGMGAVDEARLGAFLEGFQRARRLEERELALLPAALRASLIRYLHRQPAQAESIFAALRWLNERNMAALLERFSAVDSILRQDPAGVYARMDEESRLDYRRQTALLAERCGMEEAEAAAEALRLAREERRHIGEYLFVRPLGKPPRKKPYGAYLALHLLLPAALALAAGFLTDSWAAAILTLLPLRDAVKYLFDRISTKLVRPKRLPRLDYSGGIPQESRTLAVSAVLLTGPEAAAEAARRLELFRLANRSAGAHLLFGLLADLREGKAETDAQDTAILQSAAREIGRLNDKYGGGFCLLTRSRSYSERDRVWRGRERKRGAVMELTALLRGEPCELSVSAGDAACTRSVRFLIVLDGDTMLNLGSAARLAGTLAHPLQSPVLDRAAGTVRRGCAILQPKISVSLRDAERSDFARIFAGQGGLDPYGSLNSDVYQDLFGEGSYAGKGILDVDAFDTCLRGRFPAETLLSHDLIEGAYVRCGFVSDVELTDGFPASLLSYFERQHRWIRGDWQTLPWLFSHVRNEVGEWERSPLSPLDKWKIFDNLARSLTPPAELTVILLAGFCPSPAMYLSLGVVLGCLALRIAANSQGALRHTRRYRARILTAAKNDFLQLLWLLLLLPYRTYIHGSAVLVSLYRSFISRRNRLTWVTASEGDRRNRGGFQLYCRRMWPCFAAALTALAAPAVLLRALGLLWLITPALGLAISRPGQRPAPVGEDDRLFLLHCAGDILRYYEDTVTAERHWLPPDNVQEMPTRRTAERTSPTNIGLWLLGCLAASDLGFFPKEESWRRIDRTLDELKKLPKCRGHLYNWYDTRTGEALQPAFVSTVDSGNLLACLVTLAAAAEQDGEMAVLEKLRALSAEMRLDFLYDGEKALFRIGWDPAADAPAGGWYDLLESEARITSYLAVARGEAPPKHWRRLGRTLADGAGMSGLASWTGTMFEYLMPALFMPGPKGSLLAESREFCLHIQKRSGVGGVWGMSESAFAEQDAAASYAYKAHGAQGLALKHGMDREQVIAPYAAFLALTESRRAALRNLRRLRKLGAEGTYGFWEALDFTPARRGGAPFQTVRCFMAHHLGMSLLAIDNCLCGNIMQKRFMSEPANRACAELLEEKTPVGQRIRPVRSYEADPRPERARAEGFLLRTEGCDLAHPAMRPLSGGAYHVVFSELGWNRSTFGGAAVAVERPGRFSAQPGIVCFAGTETGVVSLQPAPAFADPADCRTAYDGSAFTRYTRVDGLEFSVRTTVPEGRSGEVRSITVANDGRSRRTVKLALYLEPALCPMKDYEAHPAFQRLCLESRLLDGTLTVSRRAGGNLPPMSLSVSCSERFDAETDKALVFGRGGLRSLPRAMARRGSSVRAAAEPCVFLRTELSVRPGEKKTAVFALAAASEPESSAAEARRLLKAAPESGRIFRSAMEKLNGTLPPETALGLLTPLLADTAEKSARRRDLAAWDQGAAGLWRFGISGDLPVAVCEEADGERLLAAWAFLHALGAEFDLAVRTEDEGVYGRPRASALRSLAEKLGVAGWEDKPGGFHLVGGSREDWLALLARADAVGLPAWEREAALSFRPERHFFLPPEAETAAERHVGFAAEGAFVSTVRGIGRRAWSDILTNGNLGWIADDSGSGSLWLRNARENRLTPWLNDPLAIGGSEELSIVRGGRRLSLLADADEYPTEITFGFGWVRWRRRLSETETEVTGFIPPEGERRLLLVRLRGGRASDRLRYALTPETAGSLHSAVSAKTLRRWTDALAAETEGALESGEACLAAEYELPETAVIAVGPGEQTSVSEKEAERLLRETQAYWEGVVSALRVETPSPALNAYLNGWAVYQIAACRLLGRASLYQSGGAYGFRDQLQDACALIDGFPQKARAHLLLAAGHQYREGDVMHWWHPRPDGDRGVRTRCSDDLLWLPYACCLYAEKTGDSALWKETAPWLVSVPLTDSERDRYESPAREGEAAVLEHCRRALRLVEERGVGAHGLLRIGSGDWNDGFDRVGGESVWLTWFAAMVFDRFGAVTGDDGLRRQAGAFGAAADAAWVDGQYLRGYYADGTPLGAAGSEECRIDSLAQSFAVLSGFGDPSRSRAAVVRAAQLLTEPENRLVRLFTPPFDGKEDPGYIRSYLPGVRENGGQYTHAAVWLAAACLRCGETALGWRLLEMLLPVGRPEAVYQAEPYVLAADVYANPNMAGRGGWSWYTGAAGWFLRTAVEELLGVHTRAGVPVVEPRLPADWPGYALRYRAAGKEYGIRVHTEGENRKAAVEIEEKPVVTSPGNMI